VVVVNDLCDSVVVINCTLMIHVLRWWWLINWVLGPVIARGRECWCLSGLTNVDYILTASACG